MAVIRIPLNYLCRQSPVFHTLVTMSWSQRLTKDDDIHSIIFEHLKLLWVEVRTFRDIYMFLIVSYLSSWSHIGFFKLNIFREIG